MVTPEITQIEADDAGCTAEVVLYDTHSPESGSGEYRGYKATAKAAHGWRFYGWMGSAVETYDGMQSSDEFSSNQNPWTCDSYSYSGICEYERTYSWGSTTSRRVHYIQAIFEKVEGSKKILCNASGTILHGSGGTILFDD